MKKTTTNNIKKPLTALSLTAMLLGGALATAAPAQAEVASQTFSSFTAEGATSQYHVYADGIDWSKPVGVVYYFDGDYWTTDQSKIYNPSNADLLGMAQVAASHNMVFVPVISPDKNDAADGITWWEDKDANGDWFRAFAQDFQAKNGIDSSNVWTIGYSGGAEFNTFELGADRQTQWRSGGGSVMVGGGGTNGMETAPGAATAFPMMWFAGENDVVGNTNPPEWSAQGAAQQGKGLYDASGFTNTSLTIVPGDHYSYNFPSILEQALANVPASTAEPSAPATEEPAPQGKLADKMNPVITTGNTFTVPAGTGAGSTDGVIFETNTDGSEPDANGVKFVLPEAEARTYGLSIDEATGAITARSMEREATSVKIPVTVSYPDGSSEVVELTFVVEAAANETEAPVSTPSAEPTAEQETPTPVETVAPKESEPAQNVNPAPVVEDQETPSAQATPMGNVSDDGVVGESQQVSESGQGQESSQESVSNQQSVSAPAQSLSDSTKGAVAQSDDERQVVVQSAIEEAVKTNPWAVFGAGFLILAAVGSLATYLVRRSRRNRNSGVDSTEGI